MRVVTENIEGDEKGGGGSEGSDSDGKLMMVVIVTVKVGVNDEEDGDTERIHGDKEGGILTMKAVIVIGKE